MHGRWYDPNVGRFISPDEKGEYLYGSGEDAVNWVWSAGQGAICQFVNDEALGEPAAFDQFVQGITNGQSITLYGTTCVNNPGGSAFNFGAGFGRGTSYAISVVEIVGGIDMIVGGGVGGAVTCPVTFGGGCAVGAGAVAVGAAGVVHGGAVIVRNLNAPMMMAKGPIHHIATNKNWIVPPQWSNRFKKLFARGGMDLNDAANKIPLPGHGGRAPHSQGYHQWVFNRLSNAIRGLTTRSEIRAALEAELNDIASELQANPNLLRR